jgi:hypothetical protein
MHPRRARQAAILLVIAAAGAAGVTACVGRSVPVEGAAPVVEEQLGRGSLTEVAATLIVENERMLDYRIYLTRQGGERLGIVRGPGKATFRLRGAQMSHTGDLRIVAVPIASRVAVTGSAQVPWGRTVRFRIMPNDAYLIVDPMPEPKDTTESDSTTKADTTRKPR